MWLLAVDNYKEKAINKLMSVFACVCPVIDHEFHHNIVKVAVDQRGSTDQTA